MLLCVSVPMVSVNLSTQLVLHQMMLSGDAFRSIKFGFQDIMLVGGSESSITPFAIAGFQALTALSTTEDPTRASIPFDKDRNGFVMGEGSGMLVLESLEHAEKRGATILAKLSVTGTLVMPTI